MAVINGNSEWSEIEKWLDEKNNELLELVNESKVNPSEDLVARGKRILEDVNVVKRERERERENGVVDGGDESDKLEKKVEEMEGLLSKIVAHNGTENDAALALSELMNDSTFQEIQEIEKQVLYRKFYFPGGIPKLRVSGGDGGDVGMLDGMEVEFDGMSVESGLRDPFDHWDPRYLKEYVMEARQNGFHKNFIYYDGKDYKTINFYQAGNVLKKCVDWSTGKIYEDGACDKYEVVGIVGGLIYFDKVDSFLESSGIAGGKKSLFNKMYVTNGDLVELSVEKLEALIQQSRKEFKENNFGWMANSNKFAFDSAQYLERWIGLEKKYEEYKDRVWKILEGTNALQLCTNKVNVVGNNITIQQEMSCIQTIMNSDGEGGDGGDGDEVNKQEGKRKDEVIIEAPSNVDTSINENTKTTTDIQLNDVDEEKDMKWNRIIYVLICVIVVVAIAFSLYLIFKPISANKGAEGKESVNVSLNN